MDNFGQTLQSASQTKKIVISALLLLFLPALVFIANIQTKDQLTRAAGTAVLNLKPSGTGVTQSGGKWVLPVNGEVTVDVELKTGNEEAVAYAAVINYDPTVVSLKSAASTTPRNNIRCNPSPNIISNEWQRRVEAVPPSNEGQLVLVCHILPTADIGAVPIYQTVASRPSGSTDPVAMPKNTTMAVGRLTFTTLKQATGSTLTFDSSGATGVIGWQECHTNPDPDTNDPDCIQNDTRNNILQTANNLTFDVGTTTGQGAMFSFAPVGAQNYDPSSTNDEFDVTVRMSTGSYSVDSADLVIDPVLSSTNTVIGYDKTVLRVKKVTAGTAFPNYIMTPVNVGFNSAGLIDISGVIDTENPQPVTGSDLTFATITFEPINTSTNTEIRIKYDGAGEPNDSNIVDYATNADVMGQPQPVSFSINTTTVPTATTTPSRTPTPQPTTAPGTPTPTQTVPTVTQQPSPTITSRIPVRILINLQGRAWKANNLARKVTVKAYAGVNELLNSLFDSSASGELNDETNLRLPPGSATLLIKADGYLNRRFTGSIASGNEVVTLAFNNEADALKTGDLNGSGKVEAFDYSMLLANFKKDVAGAPAAVTSSDLDGSGQVNSLDFSLMLSNWGHCDVDLDGQAIQTDCANAN